MPAGEARTILSGVAKRLRDRRVIFKKIDTAFRGPVGAELEGLLAVLGPRAVVVAPAIPRIGRVTRGGDQYVDGYPSTKWSLPAIPNGQS